jgi:hypothetical protein
MQFSELELSGLEPRARACVGAGFSREELKDSLLRRGLSFVSSAITTLQELCLECVDPALREKLVGPATRQEILRQLLAEPRISSRLPELRSLKRGGAFFRRLDEALQSARMAFAHVDEEHVMMERLDERLGSRALRAELVILSRAYEAWLSGTDHVDPPLLLALATRALEESLPGAAGLICPPRIHLFSTRAPESREQAFWDQVGKRTEVVRVGMGHGAWGGTSLTAEAEPSARWTWERWHTIDDAAERLALTKLDFEQDAVLIPDSGEARRSLGRALAEQGVPLLDPRDPTRLRWEEPVKWALLPLQAVASRFERARAIAYLRGFESAPALPAWIEEINARGLRDTLQSYSGGLLAEVHDRLAKLAHAFPTRMTCAEAGRAHLALLRRALESQALPSLAWLLPLFEAIWSGLESDAVLVGRADRPAPLLYWMERLTQRLADTPAPVERLKPEQGVRLYRLYQTSPIPARRVFILGMPADWLTSERTGGYWLSERERETLSGEFALRSRIQARDERLAVLRGWISQASEVVILDAAYAPDGRERESLLPILRELGADIGEGVEKGAHPRWVASYRALRPVQPQTVELSPVSGARELSATALDNYSRCGLQSLARDRWKLKDTREPDHDPWPDARGTILHEAVRAFVASRDESGVFGITEEEAISAAWKTCRARGLLKGDRIRRLSESRMVEWMRAFREKEQEYFERAGTRVLALENRKFRLELPEGSIVGKPDRIDEHPEGLFVIDYKTSSDLPNGGEMIDLGYRLQLPFYALAAERELSKPVIGMQFIELSRRASRSNGIFLKQYNGKQPGSLTKTTSNSRSLRAEPREEIWGKLETQLRTHVSGYLGGHFEAKPKLLAECPGCFASDLCGKRRILEDLSVSASDGGLA